MRAGSARSGGSGRAQVPGYSDERLRDKLSRHARTAGRELVEKVLWLYYAAQRPDVPRWAKLTILTALAYFILPTDAIPDFAPMLGYSDDLVAVSTAVLTIAKFVDDDVKRKARARLAKWFGDTITTEEV